MNKPQTPVALITGGARRIGAQIARTLHGAGMRLVIHYRSSAKEAEALQEELCTERPESVLLIRGDLAHTGKAKGLVRHSAAEVGRLDVLVNNASAFLPTLLDSTSEREWNTLLDTNLKAPFFLTQAAAPWLRKTGGAIVNITDIYAERPLLDHPVYSATKAGLLSLTRSLARELAPEVRVNAVAPGAILWPENTGDEVARRRLISRTPLKRMGEPEDIARAVLFLVRDAPFITGQVINVDGGRSIVP
ncbi:MAG: pteridine reductase [Pseudomonadota bacterium]|nr:pteridine reductase [Pseudomonadota bacterium]